MAFNFLGTYKEPEIRALLEFARNQLKDVDSRIDRLKGQIQRYGWLSYEKNSEGDITGYTITPENSVLAKHVTSYEYYGGDVADLNIIPRGKWLYRSKGSIEDDPYGGGFQGGEIEGAEYGDNRHRDDANPAIVSSKVKDWIVPAIRKKREKFEYKIKRDIDLVDQYLNEILLLVKRSTGAETLDELEQEINYFLSEDKYHSAGDTDISTGLPEEVDN
jgi:hypothetical protein